MHIEQLRQRLAALGAAPIHVRQMLRTWAQALPREGPARRRPKHFLPQAVREDSPRLWADLDALATLRAEHPAANGSSSRLLVALADGHAVEAVRLPRHGLCISTQVGCAVGCGFCMTGRSGLLRQLGSAEIVAQVALARRAVPVHRVVLMGMGEPAHNLDAVLEAIDLLGHEGGIGHRQITFSTVGDRRAFDQLPLQRVRPTLALSLHSTVAERRAQLLPNAPRIAPDELVALALAYAHHTGHPVQIQWTLLAGVNDGDDEVDGLVRLLCGKRAMVNLIPWNTVAQTAWQRPSLERCVAMTRALNARGILTRMRHSSGQDVNAGCGQLRARPTIALVAV